MHKFDPRVLESYLQSHVEGFLTLDEIERFSGGQSNPTYRLRSGQKSFVLRAQPPGTLLPSAHAVDREFRVMSSLHDTPVPVPRMFHLARPDSPLRVMFIVMELVEGSIHWDPALPDHSAQERCQIYDAMNATLAQLHNIVPSEVGLSDYGRPEGYFPRQLKRWSAQFEAAKTVSRPEVDRLVAWLEDTMPPEDGQIAITHGDYRIDNMIFGPDNSVSAVLDWELSTLGHPFADLAYQCMIWRLPNKGTFKGLSGIDRAGAGIPSDQDYVAAYCERRGIAPPQNWAFYTAFASFRFLAILQGVLKRGLEGNASNPLGTDFMENAIGFLAQDALSMTEA